MFINKIEDFLIGLDEHKFPDNYADLKSMAKTGADPQCWHYGTGQGGKEYFS